MAAKIALILIWFSSIGYAAENDIQRLALKVGESKAIDLPMESELKVSRKGVVDLFHVAKAKWKLTGLRKGLVIIDAGQSRVLVDVSSRTGTKSVFASFPIWACSRKGISCDKQAGIIKGKTDSYTLYLRINDSCKTTSNCFSLVTLSDSGKATFEQHIHSLIEPHFTVDFSSRKPIVHFSCKNSSKEKKSAFLDYLTSGYVSSGHIKPICHEDLPTRNYQLNAKAFLIDEGEATKLGLDSEAAATFGTGAETTSFIATLSALGRHNKAEVIGKPSIRLLSGQKAKVQSGGEFQVMYDSSSGNKREGWKKHGLELQVVALPSKTGKILLEYTLTLKNRSNGKNASLQTNSLSSTVELTQGKSVVVGGVDLSSDGNQIQNNPLLSKIPIIAPLFQVLLKQNSRTLLFLWMSISEDNDKNDLIQKSWPKS